MITRDEERIMRGNAYCSLKNECFYSSDRICDLNNTIEDDTGIRIVLADKKRHKRSESLYYMMRHDK